MSGVFNKLAGVLGFSNEAEDLDDDYDSYDEYGYDDDSDDFHSSYNNSGYNNSGYSNSGYNNSGSNITGFSDYNRRNSDNYNNSYSNTGFRTSTAGFSQSSRTPTQRTSSRTYRSSQDQGSKVVNLNANIQMEVIVSSPDSLEAAREIAEHIKLKKPVIINLERVEYRVAQRITDFLCGACCAMNGNVQRIAEKIFMIAPDNVDFAGDMALQETLNQGDLGFLYGER